MYRGAEVYSCCSFLDTGETEWKDSFQLTERRCGLNVALSSSNWLYAAGGYGGGSIYHNSAEMLDLTASSDSRGWIPVASSMSAARTGLGVAWGPDNCLYCVGGSPNGMHGHTSAERYDPRTGKWELLAEMQEKRGYCAAAYGLSGYLYAIGGSNNDIPTKVIECYDARLNTWIVMGDLEPQCQAIMDLTILAAL